MVAVVLQRQRWVAVTETVWPTNLKIHDIWPFTEKTGVDPSFCLVSHSLCLKNCNSYCSISLLGIDSLSFSCIWISFYLVLTENISLFNVYIILGWQGFFFFFNTSQMSLYHLHACNFSNKKSDVVYFYCSVYTWFFCLWLPSRSSLHCWFSAVGIYF